MENTETNNEMESKELTLEDILNDEMFTEMIEVENKTLKETGWTRRDVNEMAKFVVKNTK